MIYVSNLFYNYTYLFSFFAQYEYDDAGLQKNKCAGLPTVAYHFIKVVQSDLETFENMGAGFGLLQLKQGTPGDDLLAVLNEKVQYLA